MNEHITVFDRYNKLLNDAEHLLDKCEPRNADHRLVKIQTLLGQVETMEKLLNRQLTTKKICFEMDSNSLNQEKVSDIAIKKEKLEKAKQNIPKEKYNSLITCLGCGETFPCYAPIKEKKKYYHPSFYIHCGTCPDYLKLELYRSCDKCQVTYINYHAFASHMKRCRDKFGSASSKQDETPSIKRVKNIPPKSHNDDFI
ncbi:hypothetical protein HDE_07973 [Halotydeus destructor]|nr:hypothetical protein HDE_07973 [Halotydeus destructor]